MFSRHVLVLAKWLATSKFGSSWLLYVYTVSVMLLYNVCVNRVGKDERVNFVCVEGFHIPGIFYMYLLHLNTNINLKYKLLT